LGGGCRAYMQSWDNAKLGARRRRIAVLRRDAKTACACPPFTKDEVKDAYSKAISFLKQSVTEAKAGLQ
jgi:hypothetical protein